MKTTIAVAVMVAVLLATAFFSKDRETVGMCIVGAMMVIWMGFFVAMRR